MTQYGKLTVELRSGHGKGPARQLRRQGRIPGVVYGQGQENLSVAVDPAVFRHAMDPQRHFNTFFEVTVKSEGQADKVEPCMVADYQIDPIREDLLHVDFMRVDPEREVTRPVPVNYFGRSVGVAAGGKLHTNMRTVRVAAKPSDLPVSLEVDVTTLDGGQTLRVRDVTIPNVRILERGDDVLAGVAMPRVATPEEEAEEAAAAAAAAEKAADKGKDADKKEEPKKE